MLLRGNKNWLLPRELTCAANEYRRRFFGAFFSVFCAITFPLNLSHSLFLSLSRAIVIVILWCVHVATNRTINCTIFGLLLSPSCMPDQYTQQVRDRNRAESECDYNILYGRGSMCAWQLGVFFWLDGLSAQSQDEAEISHSMALIQICSSLYCSTCSIWRCSAIGDKKKRRNDVKFIEFFCPLCHFAKWNRRVSRSVRHTRTHTRTKYAHYIDIDNTSTAKVE